MLKDPPFSSPQVPKQASTQHATNIAAQKKKPAMTETLASLPSPLFRGGGSEERRKSAASLGATLLCGPCVPARQRKRKSPEPPIKKGTGRGPAAAEKKKKDEAEGQQKGGSSLSPPPARIPKEASSAGRNSAPLRRDAPIEAGEQHPGRCHGDASKRQATGAEHKSPPGHGQRRSARGPPPRSKRTRAKRSLKCDLAREGPSSFAPPRESPSAARLRVIPRPQHLWPGASCTRSSAAPEGEAERDDSCASLSALPFARRRLDTAQNSSQSLC